jgi:dTMP kinase
MIRLPCDKKDVKFLAFEGLDGSGKSSLMSALERELTSNGVRLHRTREPGGTPLGEELREIIVRKKDGFVPVARTELLLYEAIRAQHVEEVIRPKLEQGIWVLSDRYAASSVAFQAGGRHISENQVIMLNQFATGGLMPDLTILLDLSVEESRNRRQKRASARGEIEDRIESEADDFHSRVREGFLKQAKAEPAKWLVLDATLSTQAMLQVVLKELKERQWLR